MPDGFVVDKLALNVGLLVLPFSFFSIILPVLDIQFSRMNRRRYMILAVDGI